MPRNQKSEATPKDAPKSLPRGRLKTASKRVPTRVSKNPPKTDPNPAPKQRPRRTPRPAPIVAPIITPEQSLNPIRVYSLPHWEEPGPYQESLSPHAYGNGGKMLGQWYTQADAEEGLRAEGHCEDTPDKRHFAFVRIIDNKLGKGKQWHDTVLPDDDAGDNDLSYLDPDDIGLDDSDLLNPVVVRAKIENAKLRAQLDAASRNGHGGLGELLEGVKFVEEIKRQAAPQKSLAEQIREAKEIAEIVTPRRESNPAPQPQRSDEEILVSTIMRNPDVADKISGSVFKKLLGGESFKEGPTWEEVAYKAIENGEASKIANALVNLVSTGLGNLFSAFAPKPAELAQQAPQAPTNQTTQSAQAPQIAPAETPALPEIAQQPQATQPQIEQGPMQMAPVDALVYSLIAAMEKQAPIADAQNLINIAIVRNPELGDSVDEILNLPVDQILRMLTAYHSPVAQMTHAREWLQSFVNSLATEGDEFDEFTEIEKGEVKL